MTPWPRVDGPFDLGQFITESNRIDPQHDLSGTLLPGDRPGTLMYDNQRRAWDVLDDALTLECPLSGSLILDVHRELTRSVDSLEVQGASGQYRTREVHIESDSGPQATLHPLHIGPAMEAWCARVETLLRTAETDQAPLICWRAHADFECIHPFLDGNGRTGRLLLLYTLRRAGLPGTVIRFEERGAYYSALRTYAQAHYHPHDRVRLDPDPYGAAHDPAAH
ncbi:Fic family protein [Deinococcus soli (ex Cha et al. 2016)]|uniref:Fic family protein n=2 Tax=Deinococcus soli (ex Cha et al. 2016) TaxID=1309411 RepID=A0AAE3XDS5_9DEIO|nr:Fic family protein [Deinococcus soli (ex Cha et al. 2016)]MDR6219008.1 Fic family protein [Deinococcus soli (ex Cha et al. 2016)]MDR6328805.1 Fic family protein [Deinococcus soli (ex Cha et al. 2016)]MDR6751708.1 Fic family protein [Deinococcus soli (ex Cha et al. 2016)]